MDLSVAEKKIALGARNPGKSIVSTCKIQDSSHVFFHLESVRLTRNRINHSFKNDCIPATISYFAANSSANCGGYREQVWKCFILNAMRLIVMYGIFIIPKTC